MSLSNPGIGRKLGVGFACILVAVAVMNATLFAVFKAVGRASGDNTASYKAVDDIDRSMGDLGRYYQQARGYIISSYDRMLVTSEVRRQFEFVLLQPRFRR